MANEQNLVRGDEAHKLTAEEQSMGGKASAEARRRKRDLRKALEALLESDVDAVGRDGQVRTVSGAEAIATRLFGQAMKGNVRAFTTIRETVGQDPVQKIEISQTDPEVVKAVEDLVYSDES